MSALSACRRITRRGVPLALLALLVAVPASDASVENLTAAEIACLKKWASEVKAEVDEKPGDFTPGFKEAAANADKSAKAMDTTTEGKSKTQIRIERMNGLDDLPTLCAYYVPIPLFGEGWLGRYRLFFFGCSAVEYIDMNFDPKGPLVAKTAYKSALLEEFIHAMQDLWLLTRHKKQYEVGIETEGVSDKAAAGAEYLGLALAVELAFAEAEAKFIKLCNIFAFCKQNKPKKEEVVKASAEKRALLCVLCEQFERYCEEFDDAVQAAKDFHSFAITEFPECVSTINGEQGVELTLLDSDTLEEDAFPTHDINAYVLEKETDKAALKAKFAAKKATIKCLLDLE